MSERAEANRKAFISYSWSTPEHKAWVRRLAERLTEDGVYIILDEWDLKPGHDPIHFMEQSITNPEVTKVMIVCDRVYKEKADGRAGGVGTETQILTPEIYRMTDQGKYAALVTEVDDEGNAYVPTFYGGRIFIDFSDPEREEEAYEELIRWLNDAPLHTRPKLGKTPAFLTSGDAKPLATQSRFRRAKEALDRGVPGAASLVRDFGEGLIEQLIGLRPPGSSGQNDVPIDEAVVNAANAMRPYVKQVHELTRSIARTTPQAFDEILAILELVLSTTDRARGTTAWTPATFDANKIMAYEAFLGVIATLLAERQLDLIARALDHPYYYDDPSGGHGRSTKDFGDFSQYAEVLEYRNRRLNQNRADWQADFVHQHYQSGSPSFVRMMEADLLLFIRRPVSEESKYYSWFPHTLIYTGGWGSALELFARMESAQFFALVSQKLFGAVSPQVFKERVSALNGERLWRGVYPGMSIGSIAGVGQVASRP
ncbi:hypothetical protein ACFB49_22950 [Sphingomonas sp. DBB INV C78]|uniref:TIR domain-containing protein n=1 Tax=Sphingomonas sp. DBB INV C78 TaxID=3349434 RepID=UPI0036D31DEB